MRVTLPRFASRTHSMYGAQLKLRPSKKIELKWSRWINRDCSAGQRDNVVKHE